MILIILGVLVLLVHSWICGLLVLGLVKSFRCDDKWGRVGDVFIGTSLISSAVLDAVGIYKLITL